MQLWITRFITFTWGTYKSPGALGTGSGDPGADVVGRVSVGAAIRAPVLEQGVPGAER